MKNELGLSGKAFKKLIRKVEASNGLKHLLSVEVKGQAPIMHTFYKVKGRVIEPNQKDDYSPDEIEKEIVELPEKKTKLAESETEFKELLEQWLKNENVNPDDTSKRKKYIKYYVDEIQTAQNIYLKEIKKQRGLKDNNLIYLSDKLICYLNGRKPLVESKESSNPFLHIFIGDSNKPFELFSQYLGQYLIEPFIDFSFIYQQMKKDGYIHKMQHLSFAEWAKKEQLINKKLLDDIYEKKSLRSLRKATSTHRLNNYKLLKDKIFKTTS